MGVSPGFTVFEGVDVDEFRQKAFEAINQRGMPLDSRLAVWHIKQFLFFLYGLIDDLYVDWMNLLKEQHLLELAIQKQV